MYRIEFPVEVCCFRVLPVVGSVLLSAAVFTAAAAGQNEKYLGPSALVASSDGATLYVANADARQVAWVDLAGGQVVRRVDVPSEPTGLALTPDGARLLATCAAPKSQVLVIDAGTGRVISTVFAGHTAMAPAVAPDGRRLYVCNRFDNDVSVIDLETFEETARLSAVREPIAAALTPDGKTLLVANHLPNTAVDVFLASPVAPVITLVDTATNKVSGISLPHGSNGVRGMCVSPDGKHAYVTHLVSNFERLPSQLDLGWTNINTVSVIDLQQRKLVNTVALDELYVGAGNPWGVACTADGKWVCVAQAGTHELGVLDAPAMLGTLSQMFMSAIVGALPHYPPDNLNLQRRIKLPGKGPRALAVVGAKVYVAEYFSDTLAVVDLQAKEDAPVGTIALGPKPQPSPRRRGELLFNDATICYQQWQSCASCHPDGRTDSLNWDLMNDGIGNFKSTRSMLLAHATPPAMAEGVRVTAEEAVRSGLSGVLFADRPEEEAAAIDAYLKSLRPVPSPHLVDGRLSAAAQRGKDLFESDRVGCVYCHPAPWYTDMQMHDVRSRNRYDYVDRFDTPTLIEVWRTAPYLHDGRYLTIKEVIVQDKHGNSRGRVEDLSESEVDDLVEFVLSL